MQMHWGLQFKNIQFCARSVLGSAFLCVGVFGQQLAFAGEVHSGLELGVGAHVTDYDANKALTTAEGAVFQVGYRFDDPLSVELMYTDATHDPRGTSPTDVDTNHTLLNVLYHFQSGQKAESYLGVGVGKFEADNGTTSADDSSLNLSAGFKYHFSKHFTLRPEIGYRRVSGDIDENFFDVNLILALELGRRTASPPKPEPKPQPKDTDQDGVLDDMDQCPNTPLGEAVDQSGCPLPQDADADGVTDDKDACPNTPRGVVVDAKGCKPEPIDSDGDGVFDHVDKCPNTAQKLKVDEVGCPKRLTETVSIRLDIKFDSNSAKIKPEHYAEIQKIATFLEQYAGTVVQVEGHTDTLGQASYNKSLSQKRADAVAQVLVQQFNVEADRVTTIGYGEERPIADDSTREGRETNRRVVGEISVDTERFERR